MKRTIVILSALLMFLTGCGAAQTESGTSETTSMTNEQIELFNSYIPNITGGSYIKESKVEGNHAVITFVQNYWEYKQLKPDSKLTENDYKLYWDTGDAINKVLMGETVRVLRQFPGLASIDMAIPFASKVYSVSLDRKTVEDYFDFDLSELQQSDKWRTEFVNQYLYDKSERAKFVEKFVKIKQ